MIEFDVFSTFQDIVADPSAVGLANVTDACLGGTGICSNPDEYLFWDSVHPTTKGHQILADAVFERLVTQAPLASSDTATVKISVSDVTTPVVFFDDHLYVGGTNGHDRIRLEPRRSDEVYVYVNATRLGPFNLPPDARVVVFGHEGNDWLHAGRLSRSVILDGGAGDDHLIGGRGSDILRGGEGNDFLWGMAGDDVLYGDDGHDVLFGGSGRDRLFGGAGNDWLFGGPGDDELDGGDGYDRLFGGGERHRFTAWKWNFR